MGDKQQEGGQRLDVNSWADVGHMGGLQPRKDPPSLPPCPPPRSGGHGPSLLRALSSASGASLAGVPVNLRPRKASRTSTSGGQSARRQEKALKPSRNVCCPLPKARA